MTACNCELSIKEVDISNMHTAFLEFMEKEAKTCGFEPQRACATFNISMNPEAKGVLPGAVYGIAVILNNEQALQLEEEAIRKNSLKNGLSKLTRIQLNGLEAIPLYWGKDAAVGYRLYRHLLEKKSKDWLPGRAILREASFC